MSLTPVDGPTAPPLNITISRDEYDLIKRDIAELLECHSLLRECSKIITGVYLSEDEKTEIELRLAHFLRDRQAV